MKKYKENVIKAEAIAEICKFIESRIATCEEEAKEAKEWLKENKNSESNDWLKARRVEEQEEASARKSCFEKIMEGLLK